MKLHLIKKTYLFTTAAVFVGVMTIVFLRYSNAISFPMLPDLTTLVPVSGPQSGGTEVKLFGSYLNNASQVKFDGLNAEILYSLGNEVLVKVPAHDPGVVDVYYENNIGNDVLLASYTYEEESSNETDCLRKNKQLVCHLPSKSNEKSFNLCLPESAVKAHIAHGDYLGRCVVENKERGNVKNDPKTIGK